MGVQGLWKLLQEEGMVERYSGGVGGGAQAAVAAAVEGRAIAVDLAMWVMQAEQAVLQQHFSQEERCMKVAFERVRRLGGVGG